MINSLYDKFKHWSEKGSIYIISDPHFDDNDRKAINPNWPTSQEQINIINKYLTKNDTIIFLGDIGKVDYIRKIKAGKKILIMGNHDTGKNNYLRKSIIVSKYNTIAEAEEAQYKHEIEFFEVDFHGPILGYINNHLFDEVYEGALIISEKIILCHYPIEIPGISCIHGHTHNAIMRYQNSFGCNCICVASDVCNWTPINLGNEIKNGLLKYSTGIHRYFIDKAIENPIHKKENNESNN